MQLLCNIIFLALINISGNIIDVIKIDLENFLSLRLPTNSEVLKVLITLVIADA